MKSEYMRDHPPSDVHSEIILEMGLFGSDIQTVAITQAANGGKSTAEISTNIPLWEIIIICIT